MFVTGCRTLPGTVHVCYGKTCATAIGNIREGPLIVIDVEDLLTALSEIEIEFLEAATSIK